MRALAEPRRGSNGNTPQDPEQGRNGEQTTTEEMTMKQCNADGQRGRSDWAEETQSREPTGWVMSRLSASGPHRSSLWRRLRPRENAATLLRGARACLALLAALAVLALAVPVQAQTSVQLVSTLGQTTSTSFGPFLSFDAAQAFRTGTDTNGYKLTSVDVDLNVTLNPSGWVYSVSVWSATGTGSPNASLGTLTNPAFTTGNDVTHTFTTTGTGIDLLTSTPYVIVVDVTTRGNHVVSITNTTSDAEDSTKATGWSIANTSLYRTWNTTGSWTSFDQTRQIRVNGYAKSGGTNTAPTAAHNTVTTVVDRPYTFKEADFGFADADTGETLASVKIVTLPALGTLAVDGTAVTTNEVVTRADIDDGDLTFTPVDGASGDGYASFTFKVNDGTVDSASAYTMTINVTSGSACAAPDFGTRRNFWTGEVTVGRRLSGGMLEAYGYDLVSGDGSLLPSSSFTIGPNTYSFYGFLLFVESGSVGDLSVTLTAQLTDAEKAALRMHVCGSRFDFSAATQSGLTYTWNTDLDWSTATTRTVYLSLTAPTAANNTVTTVVDRPYTFEADDFGFVDTETGDTLTSVKIVTPPALGTLAVDGAAVTANDVVTKADIDDGDLTFTPVDGASGDPYTTFTFKVNDGTGDSASAYTMTINVTTGSACAAPDFGTRRNFWTGTVTVGRRLSGGMLEAYGYDLISGDGSLLPSSSFTIGPNTYSFYGFLLFVEAGSVGDLSVTLTAQLTDAEKAALRMHVCGSRFDFSAATQSGLTYTWNTGLDWSTETTRTVYLSLTAPPGTNFAPTAAHNTVTTVVDRPYTFEADDFGFVDTDTGDTLASVKIVTLPAVGTLAFDGTPVMQNDVVAWDDIEDDKLTFTPVTGASGTGYATFTFKVNDGTVDSASAYTMTIDVTDAPTLACAAPDLAGRNQIWTGELTVGTIIGFGNLIEGYGFSSPSATGALNNRTFNTDRNGYTVDFVGVLVGGGNDGDFLFSPTSRLTAAEKAALRLHVCDTPYDFSDAALSSLVSSYDYTWAVGLDWSSISSRTLYLSLPEGYPEPPAAAPAVPTGLSAQSVSGKPGYLRLSWTPGSAPGGSLPPIPTDYEARYRKTGATNWSPTWSFRSYGTPGFDYPSTTHAVPRGGNEAPLIYYLDPNTEYQVEVRATNSYGQSGWSNRASATTAQATTANDDGTADADNGRGPAAAPSQPTVRRVANEPGLMVRWNAPRTPTAGHILTGYDVEIEKERERDRRITTLRKSYLYKLAGGGW